MLSFQRRGGPGLTEEQALCHGSVWGVARGDPMLRRRQKGPDSEACTREMREMSTNTRNDRVAGYLREARWHTIWGLTHPPSFAVYSRTRGA